jgi:hypothetical protein
MEPKNSGFPCVAIIPSLSDDLQLTGLCSLDFVPRGRALQMAWLLKSLRNAPPAAVALTVASTLPDHRVAAEKLDSWFSAFDQRGLRATWASVGQPGGWHLGQRVIASEVFHELAYTTAPHRVASELPEFERQRAIAERAALPLRSLATLGGGIHPSITARLGVTALVTLDPDSPPLPTSPIRSHGWNQWEVAVAQRVPFDLGLIESTQLIARLYVAMRDDVTLHLLWDLATLADPPRSPALRLLDALADFSRRNQIEITTMGALAAAASHPLGKMAA